MKYLKNFFSVSILLTLLLNSCNDDDDLITSPIDLLIDKYDNIPVKVNTENSYTLTVVANDFTYSTEDDLTFLGDSIVVTITLTNANSSNSFVKLFDELNQEIFSESLGENKVVVNTEINGTIPKRIKIDLINFTGQLTIVVALDKS